MDLHRDPLLREQMIAAYVRKALDEKSVEEFESHYLACDECFGELRTTELLMDGLTRGKVECRRIGDVALWEFAPGTELISGCPDLERLAQSVFEQKDTKVLIDLSRVSRIDSSGLGELMRIYSHLVGMHGALKVIRPSSKVQKVLEVTHINSILETYDDEGKALRSFGGN